MGVNTSDGTKNYQTCNVTICPGAVYVITTCAMYGGNFTGDPVLRLFNSNNEEVFLRASCSQEIKINSILNLSLYYFILIACLQ